MSYFALLYELVDDDMVSRRVPFREASRNNG